MTDLDARLRGIDRLTPPDLWEAARTQAERGSRSQPGPSHTRRIAIVVASLVIGVAALGVIAIAFRSDPTPRLPTVPGPPTVENGDIWVQVGGGDGSTAIYRVDPLMIQLAVAMWVDPGGPGSARFGGALVAPQLVASDYAFSPDGSQVVFSAQSRPGNGRSPRELFVMRANGTELRRLTDDGAYAGFPAWSPDGRTIAYASYRGERYVPGCLGLSICPTDLYLVDAAGGSPSPLTAGDGSETTPSWSPDGSRIAFAHVSQDGVGRIVTIRSDGSEPAESLVQGTISFPSWSPRGDRILFLKGQGGSNHLWTVRADGSEARHLVDTRTDTNMGRPVWSPDGERIAFGRSTENTSVWGIDPAGESPPERIAGWPGISGVPIAWRPLPTAPPSGRPEADATRLLGIDAYLVCRPLPLPGSFGDAGDEVVVFEEERVPGAGCVESEGFQHLAVLRDGRVTSLSRRITYLEPDAWRVWPYATPDLDDDGRDEIAVVLSEGETDRRVWFFTVGRGGIQPIHEERKLFTHIIGLTASASQGSTPRGMYCEGDGDARRIVAWEVIGDDGRQVSETRWRMEGSRVELESETTVPVGERGYPDAGNERLCGSPVSPLDGYPI